MQRFGGPEVLEEMELPEPPVGPDTVLVRARAAAVNPVDYKIRAGGLDGMLPTHFPLVSGFDVAGVVERVGPAVVGFAPGDEVIAYDRQDHLQFGSYAELVPVPLRAVAAKPVRATWAEAAALPLVGLTAYQCLADALAVQDGETVLVHAASGGVGRMAVQLARILGAQVVGTANERHHDDVRELGATPVTYGDGLVERVRDVAPDGVDAVVDLAGGQALEDSPPLLRTHGRIASVLDPQRVAELGGQYVFCRPDAAQLARLAAWVDTGRLRSHVEHTFPLAEAAEAQRRHEEGELRGKVTLTVG
jgi:NADPH:quinone reductase-like Zn-dependent oxidoreductase